MSIERVIQSNGKIKRGPVVEVSVRQYSEPFPDELLNLADRAGLILDDNDSTVTVYLSGVKQAAIWGPSVEGEWFAAHMEASLAVRVATRDLALLRVISLVNEAADARAEAS